MTEYIELSLPAKPELLYLVRFHVAAAASGADWAVDEVDDLRLAADELCLSLIGEGAPRSRRLNIKLGWSDRMIELTCSVRDPDLEEEPETNGKAPAQQTSGVLPSELSERVLGALVDEHGSLHEHGRVLAWLRKQRVSAEHPS